MIAIFYLVLQILKLYSYVVIANVVISWLIAFNVLNTQNRFVYSILEMTYRLTDPILNKIRRFFTKSRIIRYFTNRTTLVNLVYRNVHEAVHCTNYLLKSSYDFNRWKKNSS